MILALVVIPALGCHSANHRGKSGIPLVGGCASGACGGSACFGGQGACGNRVPAGEGILAALHGRDRLNTGPNGPATATYSYPYYTTRGPRDFLLDNPNSIGR